MLSIGKEYIQETLRKTIEMFHPVIDHGTCPTANTSESLETKRKATVQGQQSNDSGYASNDSLQLGTTEYAQNNITGESSTPICENNNSSSKKQEATALSHNEPPCCLLPHKTDLLHCLQKEPVQGEKKKLSLVQRFSAWRKK